VYAVLYFPLGLMIGYPSVALGYLGAKAGLPVSAVAAIVGTAFFAHSFKFVWAPVGDYSLSRKKWYVIAASVMAAGIFAMSVTPISTSTVPLLTLLVLGSNLAATFLAFATEGLMAHNTTPLTRGRAAGWFQSGNQFGQTAGGGMGLYLMKHLSSPWQAGAALAAIVLACSTVLVMLEEPPRALTGESVGTRARDAWRELRGVLVSRPGRIALLLAALPIGTGAAQFLFGSLGPEWNASADTVSFALGAGGGVAIVLGCLAGGYLADRIDKPRAYAMCCAVGVAAAVLLAAAPRTSLGYAAATLFYTFALGMCVASLTGMVLSLIGDHAAATKINLFFAINTLGGLAMLRVDGFAHDRWATNGMLFVETGVGVVSIGVFIALAARIRGADRAH
jgi:MFS family permease